MNAVCLRGLSLIHRKSIVKHLAGLMCELYMVLALIFAKLTALNHQMHLADDIDGDTYMLQAIPLAATLGVEIQLIIHRCEIRCHANCFLLEFLSVEAGELDIVE